MAIKIDFEKCTGCPQRGEPMCVEVCPGDLMARDDENGKVLQRSKSDCWDCMACVKVCPHEALEVRLPYEIADYKASLMPRVRRDCIVWTVTDIEGREEKFEIRTQIAAEKGGASK